MSSKAVSSHIAFSFTNPSRHMTITYVVSLSIIAALSIAVHMMLDRVIVEQSQTGKIVNISGQQRMLSQRISLFAIDYLSSGERESKERAKTALAKMKSNHQILTLPHFDALAKNKASPLSATLQKMYFSEPLDVHKNLQLFESAVSHALSTHQSETINDVATYAEPFLSFSRKPLLESLDRIVHQYEDESLSRVNELRYAQNIVLGIIILTILIEAVFVFRPMVTRVSNFANQVQHDANHDHLSGLLNRRAFYFLAEQAKAISLRNKRPYSALMIDVDHFKQINDTYGHEAGDLAIKHVSEILTQQSRESDIIARFGGEEFLILLLETDNRAAIIAGEKIRQALASSPLQFEQNSIPMTVSCGVAATSSETTALDELIAKADKALYQAKQTGRNKTCLYSEY